MSSNKIALSLRQSHDLRLPGRGAPARFPVGADDRAIDLGAGRYVHFRADRADLRDEIDDPAHLGIDLRIAKSLVARPFGGDEHALRSGLLPQLLGDEGHEGMKQQQDLVEHPVRATLGLGLGRLVAAGKHRLDEFEIPVAEHVPDETDRARPPHHCSGAPRWPWSTASRVRATSPAIQRLTVTRGAIGSKSGSRTAPFISQKRAAFHSLVPKLR